MTGLETASASGASPVRASHDAGIASFGPFSLHDKARLLERDGVPVKLGSRALDILWLLVSRAGDVVSKNELLALAWPGLIVEEINLRVHIAEVRKALGDGKEGARYITNIPEPRLLLRRTGGAHGRRTPAVSNSACRRPASPETPRLSCPIAWSG